LTPLDVKQKTSETGPGACFNTRDLTSDLDRINPVLTVCGSRMNPVPRTKLNHNVDSLSHNHYLFPLSKSEFPVSAGAAQNKAINKTIEIEIR